MSVTVFPNRRPKRSYQGPAPTRSMAFTGLPVPSSEALRKARQPLAPAPGMLASASFAQILSAPRSPAPAPVSPYLRSPPKPSTPLFGKPKSLARRCKPAQLVTKKLNLAVATAPAPAEPLLEPPLLEPPTLAGAPAALVSLPAAPATALAPAAALPAPLAPTLPAAAGLPAAALAAPAAPTLAPAEPGAPAAAVACGLSEEQAGMSSNAEHGHEQAQRAVTTRRFIVRKFLIYSSDPIDRFDHWDTARPCCTSSGHRYSRLARPSTTPPARRDPR